MTDGNVAKPARRHIAVVGSGISGLTAAYVLQRDADVTLYEADARLGGHSHTHDVVDVTGTAGSTLAVDTGFIVHNAAHVPDPAATVRRARRRDPGNRDEHVGVAAPAAASSTPVPAGSGACSRSRVRCCVPPTCGMLTEVPRFHRRGQAVLAAGEGSAGPGPTDGDQTLAEFLAEGRYSPYFVRHFITPLVAAVWSCARQRPAATRRATCSPSWPTTGCSRSPGRRPGARSSAARDATSKGLAKELSAVLTATPVRAVRRLPEGGVEITDDARHHDPLRRSGGRHAPGPGARLLADATPAEREMLGAFRYSPNETLLHTDASVLPGRSEARASWNYRMAACQ